MVSKTIPVAQFDLTIFGASGDLAKRKIFPSLYRRMHAGQFDTDSRIIGVARSDLSRAEFQAQIKEALQTYVPTLALNENDVSDFLSIIHYVKVDIYTDVGWSDLIKLQRADRIRAFYYSVAPDLFGEISNRLVAHGLVDQDTRIVVEKPFGHDLASARDLNAKLRQCFAERQIYRIDHYLGKETVQNLMAVRFGNALFEPLWNAQHIDHVQITAAESIGVGGRGAYYDGAGAMRDMVQNHLMQLLCLIAMEPPAHFDADSMRDEKLKVIKALSNVTQNNVVRGQYRASADDPSYCDDVGQENSKTESFLALQAQIENWRWAGVPFFLRTGKRLRKQLSEITIHFKKPPHSIFDAQGDLGGNILTIRLQPDEGMTLTITIKEPGPGGMRLREVPLDMSFAEALGPDGANSPDAYERLIMDVIRGNQTLFMRGDEVEAAWAWVDPIIAQWHDAATTPDFYDQGSSGPESALMLLHRQGRRWQDIQ